MRASGSSLTDALAAGALLWVVGFGLAVMLGLGRTYARSSVRLLDRMLRRGLRLAWRGSIAIAIRTVRWLLRRIRHW